MEFHSSEAERRFRTHFHSSRCRQDVFFSGIRVAVTALAALRLSGAPADARLRVLLLATHVLAAVVVLASVLTRPRYAAVRPYLLLVVRLAHDCLWAGLLWQMASEERVSTHSPGGQSWAGLFTLWVAWSRCGYHLLMQLGHPLPFNWEALLSPFGALMGLLSHRRLCSLLTEAGPEPQRSFYRTAFTRLASLLARPAGLLFDSRSLPEGCRWATSDAGDSSDAPLCTWSLCAVASRGSGSSSSGAGAAPPGTHLATCYCEAVFGVTQLALAAPLLWLACRELAERRRFAAGEQQRQRLQLQQAEQGGGAADPGPGYVPPVGWSLSLDSMRLLLLLLVLQFRMFLTLRLSQWRHLEWLGAGQAAEVAHAEL